MCQRKLLGITFADGCLPHTLRLRLFSTATTGDSGKENDMPPSATHKPTWKEVAEAYRTTLAAVMDEIHGIPICTDLLRAEELYRLATRR